MWDLLFFHHGCLPQDLHGVDVASVPFLDQTDLAESTATDHLKLKITQTIIRRHDIQHNAIQHCGLTL
jgi:hypothetical protein